MASTIHSGVKTSPWSATRCLDLTRLMGQPTRARRFILFTAAMPPILPASEPQASLVWAFGTPFGYSVASTAASPLSGWSVGLVCALRVVQSNILGGRKIKLAADPIENLLPGEPRRVMPVGSWIWTWPLAAALIVLGYERTQPVLARLVDH